MRYQKIAMAVMLAVFVSSGAHAATVGNVKTGSQVDCLPFPSLEMLDKHTVFENGKPAFGGVVTCTVIEGQAVPKQSKFVGQLVTGSVRNTYSFVWEVLQLPDADGSVLWSNADGELLSSVANGSERVRLTFKRGLNVNPAGETK